MTQGVEWDRLRTTAKVVVVLAAAFATLLVLLGGSEDDGAWTWARLFASYVVGIGILIGIWSFFRMSSDEPKPLGRWALYGILFGVATVVTGPVARAESLGARNVLDPLAFMTAVWVAFGLAANWFARRRQTAKKSAKRR